MMPRLRPCADPACRICRHNDDEHHDSGHPMDDPPESLAEALIGIAAIVVIFFLVVYVLPVL